jgi:phosphoribosylformylglycinamidine (FGAM) synthase PurS component
MGQMDGQTVQEALRGAAYAGVTDTTMGDEVSI